MLLGVTPVYKGLAPSGEIHTRCLSVQCLFVFLNFFKSLQQVRALVMKTTLRILLSFLFLVLAYNSYSQVSLGHYKLKSGHRFSLFGLFPRFESGGYLDIKSDSTFICETYWESFADKYKGTWRLFNDTILFYDNSAYGEINKNGYAYEASYIDSISGKKIFQISDNRWNRLGGMKVIVYSKGDSALGYTDKKGIFIFQATSFDSLMVIGNKYMIEKKFKITPICCGNNIYWITISQRSFIYSKRRLRDLDRKVIFRKKRVS